jgi:HPt (histidine-containing phosphotransfer) domain-containing protein
MADNRRSGAFDSVPLAATPDVLDVADGVGRLLGDRALYAQTLARFREDYRHCGVALRAAIGGGELEKAERHAHTLKGAAGLIGAPALYLQASLLELALRNRAPGQMEAVVLVEAALEDVVRAIGAALAGATAVDAAQLPHAAQADRALVAQLAGLLDRGDGSALDLLEASGASLAAALGAAAFEEVARAAQRFDFEAALEVLRRAAQEPDQA